MTKKLFMCLMILIMASCLSSVKTITMRMVDPDSEMRSPIPANTVRIYRSAHQVIYPYDEIAFLYWHGTGYLTTAKIMASLKKEAGRLGANAVINDIEKGIILAIFVHYENN